MSVFPFYCAAGILVGASVLSWSWPRAYAQNNVVQQVESTAICGSTPEATPSGLAAVLPTDSATDQSEELQALNNRYISGIAVQIRWRDIEPMPGQFDWSKLDALMAEAETSGKWVQLDIFAGFFSPEWALAGAETDMFAIQYGPEHGTIAKLPMPWDQVYLGRWFAFVKQLAARYGKSPALRVIAAAGPTSVSEETTLPSSRSDMQKLLHDGYTPAKYLNAWEQAFHVYAQAFPNQCISLASGKRNLDVVEQAMQVFGHRLAIQENDLHAGHAQFDALDDTAFINGYSGRIITGFEMRGGSQGAVPSQVMGAAGNPPLALRRSIDKGMATNQAGRHVNYLEIYEGDVVPPAMQPVLQYGASLFRR